MSNNFLPIDTYEKAYILGLFAHNITSTNKPVITHSQYNKVLKHYLPVYTKKPMRYTVQDDEKEDVLKLFKQSNTFIEPILKEKFVNTFIRGHLDNLNIMNKDKFEIDLFSITLDATQLNKWVVKKLNIDNGRKEKDIEQYIFRNNNFVDFVGRYFEDVNLSFPTISDNLMYSVLSQYNKKTLDEDKFNHYFQYILTSPRAIAPSKNNLSDTGYDLSVIEEWKRVSDDVIIYETGVAVQPPLGYYFDVVLRSSMSKSGWTMANNVGIIDATYTGSIKIALARVDKNKQEIDLSGGSLKIAQLIPRKLHLLLPKEVKSFEETLRGSDGGINRVGITEGLHSSVRGNDVLKK